MNPSAARVSRDSSSVCVCLFQSNSRPSSFLGINNNTISFNKTNTNTLLLNTATNPRTINRTRVYRKNSTGVEACLSPAKSLRQILELPGVHQGPACFDALSAKLVEKSGFSFCFTSGMHMRLLFIPITSFPHMGLFLFLELNFSFMHFIIGNLFLLCFNLLHTLLW